MDANESEWRNEDKNNSQQPLNAFVKETAKVGCVLSEGCLYSQPAFSAHLITFNRLEVPQVLISSIKGEVKKKHPCNGRSFSCFPAHMIEQDLF